MKYLLALIFLLLVLASEETWRRLPGSSGSVPVFTWVTDNNPARAEQIALFQKWLQRVGGPPGKVELDVSNDDDTKKIIQSVSGVGSDVMDVAGQKLSYFTAIGFLADVTDVARELHYDFSHTYPALESEIGIRNADGDLRQYLFPCNVSTNMGIVNCSAFEQFHQPIPKSRWTVQDFEAEGAAYVAAANPPGAIRDHYFSAPINTPLLRENFGVATFDETQTHCTLDDPKYAEALKLIARWRQMHIIPSKADEASFSTGTAYGGASGYLFSAGNYGILWTGRYLIIQFRQDNISRVARGEPPLKLTVVEPPNGGFPITDISTRAAGVYAASKRPLLSRYFQAFLASDDYNRQIVRDGDSLPPDPKWANSEEFLHPAEDPARGIYKQTEWDFHGHFADAALKIAVGGSYSPFVLAAVVEREDGRARDLFLESGQLTAEEAVHRVQQRVNEEIARSLAENPALLPTYNTLCARQKQIDELKAAGKKVPLKWIIDPFRRAYMTAKGMTE
jgi:multiple sugar transport system substrate-binding protein